jgi:hypothetical protein
MGSQSAWRGCSSPRRILNSLWNNCHMDISKTVQQVE